jgi:hypothetical protein
VPCATDHGDAGDAGQCIAALAEKLLFRSNSAAVLARAVIADLYLL